MGRELKRVPIDFNWPLDKVWEGFNNPFYVYCHQCKACDGTGLSPTAKLYQEQWYGNAPFDPVAYGSKPLQIDDKHLRESVTRKIAWSIELAKRDGTVDWYTQGGRISLDRAVASEIVRMHGHWSGAWMHQLKQEDVDVLVKEDRLLDLTSTWTKETGWQKKDPPVVPTADEVNAWSMYGMGHDSINCHVCLHARCEREGIETSCPVCDGEGSVWFDQDAKALADKWEPQEPPTGPAYQIWETVSEGSPVSPAFETPEQLARWMVESDDGVTKDATFNQWLAFINGPGWAPSFVSDQNGFHSGVAAVTEPVSPVDETGSV